MGNDTSEKFSVRLLDHRAGRPPTLDLGSFSNAGDAWSCAGEAAAGFARATGGYTETQTASIVIFHELNVLAEIVVHDSVDTTIPTHKY